MTKKQTKDWDLSKVAPGDRLTLRCGGLVVVCAVEQSKSGHYPIGIRLEGFHAMSTDPWTFNRHGSNGEGTGLEDCPFDILRVERKPIEFTLNPDKED